MKRNSCSLKKSERMVSRKLIDTLFVGGRSHSVSVFPIRAVYMQTEQTDEKSPVQIMVSVSKRHFKRAVKRNRVKRQIREVYRQNKEILRSADNTSGKQLYIAFIWQADCLYGTSEVAKSVKAVLHLVAEKACL